MTVATILAAWMLCNVALVVAGCRLERHVHSLERPRGPVRATPVVVNFRPLPMHPASVN